MELFMLVKMHRFEFCLLFSLAIFLRFAFSGTASCNSHSFFSIANDQDTLSDKQNLYNGRVWRNIYSHNVTGDQFLFTKEFNQGSVVFNGKSYNNLKLRYDILNDEIMIITDQQSVLQLNKEMIDMFTIEYNDTIHQFSRMEGDSINSLKGFVDVLYKGNTALCVKYKKEISRLSQGRMEDVFIQTQKVFIFKNGVVYPVNKKKEFFELLSDNNQQIKNFIKINKLKLSRKVPESFIPVLVFYDNLSH